LAEDTVKNKIAGVVLKELFYLMPRFGWANICRKVVQALGRNTAQGL
jgi:hypothetical protein